MAIHLQQAQSSRAVGLFGYWPRLATLTSLSPWTPTVPYLDHCLRFALECHHFSLQGQPVLRHFDLHHRITTPPPSYGTEPSEALSYNSTSPLTSACRWSFAWCWLACASLSLSVSLSLSLSSCLKSFSEDFSQDMCELGFLTWPSPTHSFMHHTWTVGIFSEVGLALVPDADPHPPLQNFTR